MWHLRRRIGPCRQPDPRLRRWGHIALHWWPRAGGRCDGRARRCRGALSRVGRRRHGSRSALATPIGRGGRRRRARLRHHGGRRLLPRWPRGGGLPGPAWRWRDRRSARRSHARHRDGPGQARRRHVRARRLRGKTARHGRVHLCDHRRHRPARHHRIARHDAHRAGDALVGIQRRTRGWASWRALRKQTQLRGVHRSPVAAAAGVVRVVRLVRRQRHPADVRRRASAGRATTDPGHHGRRIHRTCHTGARRPAPASTEEQPAPVVKRRESPRRIVDPAPAPGLHVPPSDRSDTAPSQPPPWSASRSARSPECVSQRP